ncbi:hypothetical protein Tco_0904876 [Tanacetum coccineum]
MGLPLYTIRATPDNTRLVLVVWCQRDSRWVLLPRHGTRDPGPDLSFDTPASLECMSGLARASSAEVLLLRHGTSDSGPDMSFDTSASLEYVSGLGRASLAKYNMPGDLHLRLPPLGFVISEILNDAIGIYHRPSGINKVITFKILCRSLQIEPTVTLFRVFQSPDALQARSLLRDMPEGVLVLSSLSRVWKSRTRDPILRDSSGNGMEGGGAAVVPTPRVVGVSPPFRFFLQPTFLRLPFYYTPPAAPDAVIPGPTQEDLAASTPSTKVLAKAEASKKRRASTFGTTLSQVAKRSRSATARSSGSFVRPNLLDDDYSVDDESDDDDDACVEIPLITHIRSAATILDDVVAGSYEVSREEWDGLHQPILSILTQEVFKDPNVCKTVVDQILTHRERVRIEALINDCLAGKISVLHCLMMSHGGELLARYICLLKTHHEYVQSANSSLNSFQQRLTSFQGLESQVFGLNKLNGLTVEAAHLASDLNQSRRSDAQQGYQIVVAQTYLGDIYALIEGYKHSLVEKDVEILRLKASPIEFVSFFKATDLKKISHFVPRAQGRLIKVTHLVATTDYPCLNKVVDHSAHPLFAIIELEPDRLACAAVVPTPRVVGVSPPFLKELTVTSTPSLVELFLKDPPPSSTIASEQNEEWLSGVGHRVSEDVNQVESSSIQESGFASSGFADVVIALMIGEKQCGSPYSSDVLVTALADAGDAVVAAPSRV